MDLDKIRSDLAKMKEKPPSHGRSKKKLIMELASDIRELRADGHSFESILETIEKGGLTLKESTLKKYLSDAQKTVSPAPPASGAQDTAPKRQRKRKAPSSADSSSGADGSGATHSEPARLTPGALQSKKTSTKPTSDGSFTILEDKA